jgi:hypothetical protein
MKLDDSTYLGSDRHLVAEIFRLAVKADLKDDKSR